MKRIIFLTITSVISVNLAIAYNLPTIAVPNIIYTAVEKQRVSSTSTSADNLSSTSTSTVVKREAQKELPMFSADIKGALINSKQFKVVDMPKANSLWNGNPQVIINHINHLNKSTNAKPVKESESSNVSKNNLPDYILLGTLSSISDDADIEPIQNTNKMTSQYNIDISVDYQVVSTKDNSVVASFNAYGHANDVKILNANDTVQRQNHNIPKLVHEASKDLADNVLAQLKQQFSVSSKTYNTESISNLKIYN
ncbi:MAG: hypothetical protein ACK5Z5_09100 [Neisseriaceae bacterium]